MAGFFYNLGRLVGPKVRKAEWVVRSLTGSEAEAVRAEQAVGRTDRVDPPARKVRPVSVPVSTDLAA